MATMCLEMLAREVEVKSPKAAEAIRGGFYMDDLLWGAATLEEAIKLREEIHSVLLAANFKLRKYQSNSSLFLDSIEIELVEKDTNRYVEKCVAIAVLGMIWTTKLDEFRIKIPESLRSISFEGTKLTKRLMLSILACVFDPLGLIAPVIIRGKLMLQQVWIEKKGWNDLVSPELSREFVKYCQEIPQLEEFAVPRRYSDISPDGEKRLIAFCDASERAYCAAFYLQVCTESKITCSLICSKTRVAPIKRLTIPRLELQAAVLLAKSVPKVAQLLEVPPGEVIAFSDSQVVLAWLQKPEKSWRTFIADRIRKIVSFMPSHQWHYIQSKNNPADCGTRGMPVSSFLKSNLWKFGPSFLLSKDLQNFLESARIGPLDTDVELKPLKTGLFTGILVKADFLSFIDNFSSFLKLIRTVARILRLANRKAFTNVSLSASELTRSELSLVRLIQKSVFSKEYQKLSQGQFVSKRSSLRSYLPFLDDDGIIRICGRIQGAEQSFDKINPILLPARCTFTRLMVRHFHLRYYHAGNQFLCNFLSAKYRFVGGLAQVVKSTLRACVVCARYRKETVQQVFGDLPKDRTVVNAPFAVCGVDFAGPFWCKPLLTRSKVRFKVYAAIFVCFATKAVHIEVATALSAEAFLSVLQRFIARRGLPHTIWSDNGTNFRAAAKYVSDDSHLSFEDARVSDFAANHGVTWRFNPPRAPHRGGLWEAAVKSAKHHMVRTIGEQVLDYERYLTLFVRIEAILNSRPLCARKAGHDSFSLTPAHFLIGRPMVELPPVELSPIRLNQRFEHIQRLTQTFWHVWQRDYLNQLQQRAKWQRPSTNLAVDEVVLMKSDLVPAAQWKMARVVEVFPDKSGAVRTVKVSEASGSVKVRDVRYLIRLPVEDSC